MPTSDVILQELAHSSLAFLKDFLTWPECQALYQTHGSHFPSAQHFWAGRLVTTVFQRGKGETQTVK